MTIKSDRDKWIFVAIVTAVSVIASLIVTWGVSGVGREQTIAAVAVPMIVAPLASLWSARLMLRIHQLNRKLEYLLRHDQMTGLLTREAFFDGLKQDGSPRTGALLMLDIDRFKSINDAFGHHVGDRVIRQVAQILQEKTKPDGAAARFGGEEFVSFYPGACLEHAELRAEAIRSAVENQCLDVSGTALKYTLSIGMDVFDGTRSLDEVLRSADAALYEAKNTGRNRVVRQVDRDGAVD